jgi:hypothetical protein
VTGWTDIGQLLEDADLAEQRVILQHLVHLLVLTAADTGIAFSGRGCPGASRSRRGSGTASSNWGRRSDGNQGADHHRLAADVCALGRAGPNPQPETGDSQAGPAADRVGHPRPDPSARAGDGLGLLQNPRGAEETRHQHCQQGHGRQHPSRGRVRSGTKA